MPENEPEQSPFPIYSYIDQDTGHIVYTATHHLRRGSCCQNECRHCPYGYTKRKQEEREATRLAEAQKQKARDVLDKMAAERKAKIEQELAFEKMKEKQMQISTFTQPTTASNILAVNILDGVIIGGASYPMINQVFIGKQEPKKDS